MSKKLYTRRFTREKIYFSSTKKLENMKNELSIFITIYEAFNSVFFWKREINTPIKCFDIYMKIWAKWNFRIYGEIRYYENGIKCFANKKIEINGKKRNIRVLKTILEEIEKELDDREKQKNKLINFMNNFKRKRAAD